MQVTLALIKPTVCTYIPDVVASIRAIQAAPSLQVCTGEIRADAEIARTASLEWEEPDAARFYEEHRGKFYYDRLILGMTSGRAVALALAGPDAIRAWRALIGPTKAYRGKWEAPDTLRARFGLGDTRNGFHGSGAHGR